MYVEIFQWDCTVDMFNDDTSQVITMYTIVQAARERVFHVRAVMSMDSASMLDAPLKDSKLEQWDT
ncbi:hypothetical protein Bpfe_006798, partial [Biomphalaria pfeifferi]